MGELFITNIYSILREVSYTIITIINTFTKLTFYWSLEDEAQNVDE